MSELDAAIVGALEKHGGWAAGLQLRDMLPNGLPRGEPFDLALLGLAQSKRLEVRATDNAGTIYRLRAGVGQELAPATPITAPGHARAVNAAFHPPPPATRVSLLAAGDDEVPPPNPNAASTKKREETSMRTETESPKARILKMLAAGPMRTAAIAKKLDITAEGAGFHLRQLLAQKKVGKASRVAPWALLNGKGAASAPKAENGRGGGGHRRAARTVVSAVTAATACVEDLELKLQVLGQQAERAGKIGGFVLREIREDLQRLGATVSA